MSIFGYLHHDEDQEGVFGITGEISLLIIRNLKINCGPVPIPDFEAHRKKILIPYREPINPSFEGPRPVYRKFVVDAELTGRLPDGYTAFTDGSGFIVVDDTGCVCHPRVFSNAGTAHEAAWRHFSQKEQQRYMESKLGIKFS